MWIYIVNDMYCLTLHCCKNIHTIYPDDTLWTMDFSLTTERICNIRNFLPSIPWKKHTWTNISSLDPNSPHSVITLQIYDTPGLSKTRNVNLCQIIINKKEVLWELTPILNYFKDWVIHEWSLRVHF
jgi:hypothetical protein